MADLHGNEPVEFDNATADALIHALNGSAESIDGQSGSRTSYVTTAAQEFRGHFSDLFASNSDKAHNDGRTIADNLRTVATWVQQMKEAAERENARRKKARDWYEEHEDGTSSSGSATGCTVRPSRRRSTTRQLRRSVPQAARAPRATHRPRLGRWWRRWYLVSAPG